MLLSSPLEQRRQQWNARRDSQAVQGLVSALLADHRRGAVLSQDAESLDALCTDLAARYAACGADASRGQEAAAGIDLRAVLPTAESALRRSVQAVEMDLLMAASVAHAALLASMDAEAARSLLEEPWLSYLAASVTAAPEQEHFSHPVAAGAQPSGQPSIVARKLAGAAALVSAAQQMEQGFEAYGPGESGARAKARLRTELLESRCMSAVLTSATAMGSAEGADGQSCADSEVAQRALTLCCRRLLEVMTDDLDACGTLLQHGALADLLRTAQAEGGAAAAGMAAAFTALSASPEFAGALAEMPPLQGCALVDLAAAEVQQLGPAIAVAGVDAAGMAVPCFGALLNVCRADALPLLVHRLADRGIVGLLIEVIQNSAAPKVLRLETADALCRLIPLEDRLEASLPIAALQGIATPSVVIALVGLCSDIGSTRSGRGSLGSASRALQGPCEALRYRLPWLLAAVARIAATADLKAWTAEETGVRTLLVDGFSSLRSREVQAWCFDVLAALCLRLAPDFFIAFLCRGPTALLDLWPMMLDSKAPHVRARAVIVGYYVSSCLPHTRMSPCSKVRTEFLCLLPLRGVDCDFWSGTGAAGDAGRQLAQVAAAAAAVFAGEALPQGLAWYMRIAVCRVIASGLSALQLLNAPREGQQPRTRAHREAVEILLAWLQQVLCNFHEVLSDVGKHPSPTGAQLHPEAAALLADFLSGPLLGKVCSASGDALSSALPRLQVEAVRLLEALLFGEELYPGLEAALTEQDVRSRAEKPTSTPASAPVALERAIRCLGELEHGRWLTRLLIRSFSSNLAPAAQTSAFTSMEESAKSIRLRPAGAFPCTSSTDVVNVQWRALATELQAVETLDALLSGKTGEGSDGCRPSIVIGGGCAQFHWVGNLLSRNNRCGLRVVLHFLERADGAVKYCGEDRPLLAAAVLQRIAVNHVALGLESSLDVPTTRIALSLAAQLLEPLTLAVSCLDQGCSQDDLLGSASSESLGPCIRLHRAIVEAFIVPKILQQDVSMLAEAFAYLWALVHALGAAQPLQKFFMEPSGEHEERFASKACVELWQLVLRTLAQLLAERAVVKALCHSDDNAAVLRPIRQFLGKLNGMMPIFASPRAYQAQSEIRNASFSKRIIDLHSESWCPPGRVLLAAFVRLRSLTVCMPYPSVDAYDKFLALTMNAAVQVVEFVARPGNILHCSADVLAVLEEAALMVTTPLTGAHEYEAEMQRRAAILLVTILHRPSIEALLKPDTSLEALKKVEQGMSALQWCACPDSQVDLGSCGLHARALLRSLDDQSALEEAGVLEEWCVSPGLDAVPSLDDANAWEEAGLAEESHLDAVPSLDDTSALEEAGVLEEWVQEGLSLGMEDLEGSDCLKVDAHTVTMDGGITEACSAKCDAGIGASEAEIDSACSAKCDAGIGVSEAEIDSACSTKCDAGIGASEAEIDSACSTKCDAGIGVSEAEIDSVEEQQLRAEVSALDNELGSLEAELDAELHELEQDIDEMTDEVYEGLGAGDPPAVEVDKLLHADDECGPEAEDALPEEAFEWLRVLMAGEGELGSVRDSILSLVSRASQEQQSLSQFEAECLVEIYRHQAMQEEETLGVSAMRLALRYLYENVPSWNDDSLTNLNTTQSTAFGIEPVAAGVELAEVFNVGQDDVFYDFCEEKDHFSEKLAEATSAVLLEAMD